MATSVSCVSTGLTHTALKKHTEESDENTVVVADETFGYVEPIVQSSAVGRIEDLTEDKNVRTDGVEVGVEVTVGGQQRIMTQNPSSEEMAAG